MRSNCKPSGPRTCQAWQNTSNQKWKYNTPNTTQTNLLSEEFTLHELDEPIKTLVNGNAAGLDDIKTKLLKHLRPNCQRWLLKMFHACIRENSILKVWRKTKTIAILKPGKKPQEPKSFRPISLLCDTYKLLKRMILDRLLRIIDEKLIPSRLAFDQIDPVQAKY